MADNILLFKQMLPVHSTGLEKEIKRILGKEIRLPSYKQVWRLRSWKMKIN